MFDFMKRHVMTIINITPDSFFEGSRTSERETIRERVLEAIEDGATILDVGGYSSRPGADEVSVEEECRRVELGIEVIREVSQTIAISVDTFRAEVVRRVAERFGYIIVNDIMAGEGDEAMFGTVAQYRLPYIAMHMRGTPQSMQSMVEYRDVVGEVVEYFRDSVATMRGAGIKTIILDPGFGFAKSLDQNYELLAGLSDIVALGYPVLVGVSRKSMIYRVLDVEPSEALAGTIALGWESLRQGATILRVHDTREAVDTVSIFEKYKSLKV